MRVAYLLSMKIRKMFSGGEYIDQSYTRLQRILTLGDTAIAADKGQVT
jgi:hypothetical protein